MRENFQERRDSIRVKRIVTVRHRLFKRAGKKKDDIWQLSTTEDMSYSGLLFSSVLPYKIGDEVELQVVMSGVLYLFNGTGRVVRVVEQKKTGAFHVGVQYIGLKVKDSLIDQSAHQVVATVRKRRATRPAKKI